MPPATAPRTVSPSGRRRGWTDAVVGFLLVAVAVLALVAGGALPAPRVAQASEGRALVLQCPLGVHRVPLGPAGGQLTDF